MCLRFSAVERKMRKKWSETLKKLNNIMVGFLYNFIGVEKKKQTHSKTSTSIILKYIYIFSY